MSSETACLGCGEAFDWDDTVCPECGWNRDEWAESGRHGLSKDGHGEPADENKNTGGGIGGLGPIR